MNKGEQKDGPLVNIENKFLYRKYEYFLEKHLYKN